MKFKTLRYQKLQKINLHTQKISAHSALAKNSKIREILKNFQTAFQKKIKIVVLKERHFNKNTSKFRCKIFFKCNLEIASVRRHKELKKINPKINLKEVKKPKNRNILDTKRKNSPLLKHRVR